MVVTEQEERTKDVVKSKKKSNKKKKEEKKQQQQRQQSNVPDTTFSVSMEVPEPSKYLRRRDDDDNDNDDGNGWVEDEEARLARSSEHQHNKKRKLWGAKKVLDEDTYNATLSHIITRNFYPDLKELRALTGGVDKEDVLQQAKPDREGARMSMTEFFKRYKSEDDHSYDMLTEREDRHDAKKKRWLLATEAENQLLRIEAAKHPERGLLIPWKYEKRNGLFYTPGNAPLTSEEREDLGLVTGEDGDAPLSGSISLAGTRLQDADGADMQGREVTLRQPITRKDMLYNRIGMVNPDRIRAADASVRVAAKFVATPSPAPGATPPVTWGKVVGAPVALARMRTPVDATPGPLFSLPAVSKREEIGNTLAEKANKALRARRLSTPGSPAAAAAAVALRSKAGARSPAMQRVIEMITQKKRGSRSATPDTQLRAFYSPTPSAGLPPPLQRTLVRVKEEEKD